MLSHPAFPIPMTRRDWLRAGVIGGLSLPTLLKLQQAEAAPVAAADACILVYCWGAPSQLELLDPKPDAPAEVRGEFGITKGRVPGTMLGELLPRLAARNDQYATIRTCAQSSTSHQPGAYEALTGFKPTRNAVELTATKNDYPNLGSVISKLAPPRGAMPPFVTLPQLISDVGNLAPGQFAGFLGRQHDPLSITRDPNAKGFNVAELTLPAAVPTARLGERRALLEAIDKQLNGLRETAGPRALDLYEERAMRMLTSPEVQEAFQLGHEKAALRDRYGRNTYGQSCLLARRLVEAGVKLVTVFSAGNGKTPQHAWDTHSDNFKRLKKELTPSFDQGTAALIDDLRERGLSKRTLLIVMSEFGRSPKVNKEAGRDHWAKCYSIVMMGAGVKAGLTHGRSDKIGSEPIEGRVFHPSDVIATIYERLGIDYRGELNDVAGRPLPVTNGSPMSELF